MADNTPATAIAEAAQGAEPGGSPAPKIQPTEPAPAEAEKGRASAGVQKRIDELTRARREKEREVEAKDTKIQELEDKLKQASTPPIERPQRAKFETDEAYYDAIEKYQDTRIDRALEQRESERKQKEAAERAKNEATEAWKPFVERAAGLEPSKFPDLDKAIAGEGVYYSSISKDFVRTSPVGPQLAYHFYQHPELALEIAKLPAAEAAQKLLDVQAEIVKAAATKPTSTAPAPINPVSGGAGPVKKDEDKMTTEEWMAARNKGEIK